MLQNETLVAKIGFDTEENEPAKVSRKSGVQNGSAGGHVRSHMRPASAEDPKGYRFEAK